MRCYLQTGGESNRPEALQRQPIVRDQADLGSVTARTLTVSGRPYVCHVRRGRRRGAAVPAWVPPTGAFGARAPSPASRGGGGGGLLLLLLVLEEKENEEAEAAAAAAAAAAAGAFSRPHGPMVKPALVNQPGPARLGPNSWEAGGGSGPATRTRSEFAGSAACGSCPSDASQRRTFAGRLGIKVEIDSDPRAHVFLLSLLLLFLYYHYYHHHYYYIIVVVAVIVIFIVIFITLYFITIIIILGTKRLVKALTGRSMRPACG